MFSPKCSVQNVQSRWSDLDWHQYFTCESFCFAAAACLLTIYWHSILAQIFSITSTTLPIKSSNIPFWRSNTIGPSCCSMQQGIYHRKPQYSLQGIFVVCHSILHFLLRQGNMTRVKQNRKWQYFLLREGIAMEYDWGSLYLFDA